MKRYSFLQTTLCCSACSKYCCTNFGKSEEAFLGDLVRSDGIVVSRTMSKEKSRMESGAEILRSAGQSADKCLSHLTGAVEKGGILISEGLQHFWF